jgi:predicted transcriptional regulator
MYRKNCEKKERKKSMSSRNWQTREYKEVEKSSRVTILSSVGVERLHQLADTPG